jgi:formylmethanofuran dehydrogenase subunit E
MAHYAMDLLGIDNESKTTKMMVFVECDRCPADSIAIVTGCRVGKRTFKCLDYGKIAASFLNKNTGKAVRISRIRRIHPAEGEDMIEFYKNLPYEEMLRWQNINIELKPCDLPGPPVENVDCEICGENICDSRHKVIGGKVLCKACADGGYYKLE